MQHGIGTEVNEFLQSYIDRLPMGDARNVAHDLAHGFNPRHGLLTTDEIRIFEKTVEELRQFDEPLEVRCSWCDREFGIGPTSSLHEHVTHTVCARHLAEQLAALEKTP